MTQAREPWHQLCLCSSSDVFPRAALAQGAKTDEYPKIEVFIGYSAIRPTVALALPQAASGPTIP